MQARRYANGPEEGALSRHVRPADDRDLAAAVQREIVSDHPIPGDQRMAQCLGIKKHGLVLERGHGPVGMIERQAGQTCQSLELGQHLEPSLDVGSRIASPTLQLQHRAQIPKQQAVDREMHHPIAQIEVVDEVREAMDPRRSWDGAGEQGLAQLLILGLGEGLGFDDSEHLDVGGEQLGQSEVPAWHRRTDLASAPLSRYCSVTSEEPAGIHTGAAKSQPASSEPIARGGDTVTIRASQGRFTTKGGSSSHSKKALGSAFDSAARKPRAANCWRQSRSGVSSRTAAWLRLVSSRAPGNRSQSARRRFPIEVWARQTNWNREPGSKQSRSSRSGMLRCTRNSAPASKRDGFTGRAVELHLIHGPLAAQMFPALQDPLRGRRSRTRKTNDRHTEDRRARREEFVSLSTKESGDSAHKREDPARQGDPVIAAWVCQSLSRQRIGPRRVV